MTNGLYLQHPPIFIKKGFCSVILGLKYGRTFKSNFAKVIENQIFFQWNIKLLMSSVIKEQYYAVALQYPYEIYDYESHNPHGLCRKGSGRAIEVACGKPSLLHVVLSCQRIQFLASIL